LRALFDSPTVAALAGEVLTNLAGRVEEGELTEVLGELEGLSEEEARRQATQGGAGSQA